MIRTWRCGYPVNIYTTLPKACLRLSSQSTVGSIIIVRDYAEGPFDPFCVNAPGPPTPQLAAYYLLSSAAALQRALAPIFPIRLCSRCTSSRLMYLRLFWPPFAPIFRRCASLNRNAPARCGIDPETSMAPGLWTRERPGPRRPSLGLPRPALWRPTIKSRKLTSRAARKALVGLTQPWRPLPGLFSCARGPRLQGGWPSPGRSGAD